MDLALPPDIIRDVAHRLPQKDLLHFAYTCKTVYATIHPEIYSAVIVDSSRRVFHDFPAPEQPAVVTHNGSTVFEPVVIRSLFALTKFFKTLISNPRYGRYLRVLIARCNFPDIPELELNVYLRSVLPSLVNLHVLNWYSEHYPLPVDLLAALPAPALLSGLCGNFQFMSLRFPDVAFSSLSHLDLSNFVSEKTLTKIDLSNFPKVTSLTLSRTPSSQNACFSSSLDRCCQSALNASAENLATGNGQMSSNYIQRLFSSPLEAKLNLSSLVLRNINVCAGDARLLLENIHVPLLAHLSLDNCFETLFENEFTQFNSNIRRRNPPASLFLDILAKSLTNLKSLSLNLANELCFNNATFRAISSIACLEKLSVHIKHFQTDSSISLSPLVNSLQTHVNSLRYLNLCCDYIDPPGASFCPRRKNRYELKSILGLSAMKFLKVLRLPVTFDQVRDVPNILSNLTNLKIVQLAVTGSDSSNSPAACGNCPNTLIFPLYNTNCLISDDYFNCPSSFASTIEEKNNQQYIDFARLFKNHFHELEYIRFDLKNQSMVFDCRASDCINTTDSVYIERFDSLVRQHV